MNNIMSKKLTYSKAYEELEDILNEIQSDAISIDVLVEKVKRSRELLSFCREKLREAKQEIEGITEQQDSSS
jgi:exodeoxyribonuclease VII small subunit